MEGIRHAPKNAQTALDGWIAAVGPVVEKIYGTSEASWAQVRADFMNGLDRLFPAREGVSYGTTMLDTVPTMTTNLNGAMTERVLLYIHGGGYVHGGVEGYRGLTGRLAKALNAKVYAPDYRQAPDFPFPTPINDVFSAYRAMLSSGADPRNLVLAGDSAGGAMVVTMMRKARDAGIALPAAGAAFSPWANLTHSGLSATVRDGIDPLCSVEFLNKLARMFLAGALPTHPDASPVFADVHDLAPTLIQIGENEVMLSDAIRLASNLGEARVRTSLEVWPVFCLKRIRRFAMPYGSLTMPCCCSGSRGLSNEELRPDRMNKICDQASLTCLSVALPDIGNLFYQMKNGAIDIRLNDVAFTATCLF